MEFNNWVTIFSCAGAAVASLVGGTWILSWKFADQKAVIDRQVSDVREKTELDAKELRQHTEQMAKEIRQQTISDTKDVQEKMEEKFVCKNVCAVLHAQTRSDVDRIEKMVEKKFDDINVTLEKLFEVSRNK